MPTLKKRWIPITFLTSLLLIAWVYYTSALRQQHDHEPTPQWMGNRKHSAQPEVKVQFKPGKLKKLGEKYSKRLVVPRSGDEDVQWVEEHFGGDEQVGAVVYNTGEVRGMHPPK